MTLTFTIGGTTQAVRCPSFTAQFETGSRIPTAQFAIEMNPATGDVPQPMDEVAITNTDTGASVFGGYVTKVTPKVNSATSTEYECDCQGYTMLLARTVVAGASYASQADSAIIADLFTDYLSEIDASTHVSTVATIAIDIENQSLAQILDRICELTGGQWYVTADKKLVYRDPTTNAAPWGFAEGGYEDNSTTFTWLAEGAAFSREFSTPCNYVTVVGMASGNANISATAQDAASQATYGRVWSKTVIDRNIKTAAEAQLRANIEIDRYANPQNAGTFSFDKDGLMVGMYVPISAPSWGVSGSHVIQRMRIQQKLNDLTRYTIEFGPYKPDAQWRLVELARMMQKAAPGAVPRAVPADTSITAGHFAASIEPVGLVNAAPNGSGQLAIAKTTTTVYNANDFKLYRWNNILSVYVRKVGAGDLEADSVTAGCIAAGAIRAEDTVFASAAIQAADIANAQIKNAHFDRATADKIQIQSADIVSLSADKITTGTLDASKVSVTNLDASHIVTGIIDAEKIGVHNLDADNITAGSISVARLSAGTATFTGDVTLDCGTADLTLKGGSITLLAGGGATASVGVSATGVTVSASGGSTEVDAGAVTCTTVSGSAYLTWDGVYVGADRVLCARLAAVGDASIAHATASFADVNAALNALGTKINTILDRIGTSGQGMTAD